MSLVAMDLGRRAPRDVALADERRTIDWGQLDDLPNRAINPLIAGPDGRIAVFAASAADGGGSYQRTCP